MKNQVGNYNVILRYGNHETFLRGEEKEDFSNIGLYLKDILKKYKLMNYTRNSLKKIKSFENELISKWNLKVIKELDVEIDFLYVVDICKVTAVANEIRLEYFMDSVFSSHIYRSVSLIIL